ncbi:GNAT family N-acetyltransferase [Paramixta manurensis]|uniref:GNAT family N-acetyltransferase n=1 Tax=Paramixta manurensis TaxID=2740817 RepID=A0A6M8UGS7_9GAMM|nr:GNAT family N-acetyltransferase [Erwiniaceae bacterium PD-1]
MVSIQIASDEPTIAACFAVMQALRPHLQDKASFIAQLERQSAQGYRLFAAHHAGQVIGVAGYRELENFLYGRFIYLDDLVVAESARNLGVGQKLIEAVRHEAKRLHCAYLVLDTGLANCCAQKFYFRHGFLSRGLHFSQSL